MGVRPTKSADELREIVSTRLRHASRVLGGSKRHSRFSGTSHKSSSELEGPFCSGRSGACARKGLRDRARSLNGIRSWRLSIDDPPPLIWGMELLCFRGVCCSRAPSPGRENCASSFASRGGFARGDWTHNSADLTVPSPLSQSPAPRAPSLTAGALFSPRVDPQYAGRLTWLPPSPPAHRPALEPDTGR